ncbi:MAG: ABC transporter substrate-binding protein [Bacillales bacterium]
MVLKKRIVFLLLPLLLLLGACSDSASSGNGTGSGRKYDGKVVNLGYSGPLSGPAALYGENTLNGLSMAVEEINENGGFVVNGEKHYLNLVTLDDKYLPNDAGVNAKRLVHQLEEILPIFYKQPHFPISGKNDYFQRCRLLFDILLFQFLLL